MKFKEMSIKFKLLLIVILGIVLMTGVVVWRVRDVSNLEAKKAALTKAQADLATGYEIIDQQYPGEWRLEGDQLYKGQTLMNENYQLVDKIGRLTQGNTVTIFAGDKRVATNVMAAGKRAVGTRVSGPVKETVLKSGQNFYGEANVVGHLYQTAYQPLRNAQGKIVGIWYVGTSMGFVKGMVNGITVSTALSTLIVGIILALLIFIFIAKVTKPINDLSNYAVEIAAGNLTIEIEDSYLKKKDEVGKLAQAFAKMRSSLQNLISGIDSTVEDLSDSSQELTATREELAASADQVGDSIQQIASGAEEQSAQIEETASIIFNTIIQTAAKLEKLIENIEKQSTNMDTNSELVRSAVKEVALVSEEAAQNAEAVAAASNEQSTSTKIIAEASEDLADSARKLGEMVKKFSI